MDRKIVIEIPAECELELEHVRAEFGLTDEEIIRGALVAYTEGSRLGRSLGNDEG